MAESDHPAPIAAARRGHPGLGSYLAFSFSLLSILVTAVLLMVSEIMASAQVRSSIGNNLAELAAQTTSRMDRAMFERYREVQLMAERLAATREPATVRAEIDGMQRTYPNYAWIGLADPSGRVVASTGGLLQGQDVSARPWFGNAQRGVLVGDVHEAVLLAQLLPRQGEDPMRFVDIAFPVAWPGSERPGVLGVHLSWNWAREIEKAIFAAASHRTVDPVVVSTAGVVLLGPPELQGKRLDVPSLQEAALPRNSFGTERWPDGQAYLVGYSRDRGYLGYPGLGWRVLVRQDLQLAYAPVRELQWRLAAWGLGVAALFSLVGWLAARIITRPLIELSAAARELEAGAPLRPGPQAGPYREVSVLGQALDSLVGNLRRQESALRELNASLERRVEERTAALRETFAQVRENEQRIQTVLESAPDPFIAVDFEGRITDWNPRAEALFGWRREEVLGRPFPQVLLPARFRASAERAIERFRTERRLPFPGAVIERVVVDRSGREIEVELRLGLVDTGKLQLLCAFMHDISRRNEVDRLKSEFVSTVSHELRTPLTSIYGALRLMASGVAGPLAPKGAELLELCTRSCERLVRLINDVLDVEKIASGRLQLQLETQGLKALVERGVRDTESLAASLGVPVLVDAPQDAMVRADGDRIIQVVVNLLSNALKYSPRGGRVDVRLDVLAERARVSVVDHGPGIPPEFRDRLFERFAQADGSDRREKGGTGLGLNICRSIVQAHGGTIGVDSEPRVRTAFHFELPLAVEPAAILQ